MADGTGEVTRAGLGTRRRAAWTGYAAGAWAFLFAVPSFYWAAGGTVGMDTIARDPEAIPLINDPLVVLITGVLKVLAGLFALALVQPWGQVFPRRLLLTIAWGASALLILYGGALLIQHGLMVAGIVDTPDVLGQTAARWHFGIWDPWWLLGGFLFATAARHVGHDPATDRNRSD